MKFDFEKLTSSQITYKVSSAERASRKNQTNNRYEERL